MSETMNLTAPIEDVKRQLDEFDAENASLCSYWPIVKTVLATLESLAKDYPTIQKAIKALIAAGDAVCP